MSDMPILEKYEKRPTREKVTLKGAGVVLNLVTDENQEYMEKLAREIDKQVTEKVISNTRISKIDAALYSALQNLDAYCKLREELNAQKERTERICREFALLKEENAELKTLLGGASVIDEEKSDESESEKE